MKTLRGNISKSAKAEVPPQNPFLGHAVLVWGRACGVCRVALFCWWERRNAYISFESRSCDRLVLRKEVDDRILPKENRWDGMLFYREVAFSLFMIKSRYVLFAMKKEFWLIDWLTRYRLILFALWSIINLIIYLLLKVSCNTKNEGDYGLFID